MSMKTSGAFMKPWAFLLAVIAMTAGPGVLAESVDELTLEQAQQVADNFQALRDSLDQGKEKIEELQEKIERIKQHKDWFNDPKYGRKLQQALDALENNGLSSKLKATHDALNAISRGADQINSRVDQIKGHYDKVRDFYDKWHPDSNNPVRPLELVSNGLGELESIIQNIDPSPDNILTKPITAFIDYYKQASTAFAGALTRVQEQIEERRQHCIGTSCENSSKKGKAFAAKFPDVGPAWLYRPLQEGEVWYDGDGRAFLWWQERWVELQGGINRFEEVNRGWRLAHGQVISTSNLEARINHDYQSVIDAGNRATGYWDMLSASDGCRSGIFQILKQRGMDRDSIMADANDDHETFIARYKFLQSARNAIDALVGAFSNTLLVHGVVVDDQGGSVEGASVHAGSPGGSASTVTSSGGAFTLQFNLKPDPASRQNASVTVSHQDYAESKTEQRLWQQCENWHIILKPQKQEASAGAMAGMQEIRDTANARAAEIDEMCRTLQARADQIDAQLGALSSGGAPQAPQPDYSAELSELARRAGELAQASDARAKALAEVSQSLSGRVNKVCETTGQIESTRDGRRQRQLYEEMQFEQQQAAGNLDQLRSGFADLDAYSRQAGTVKSRVDALRDAIAATPSSRQDNSGQMEAVRQALAQARDQGAAAAAGIQELETSRTRAAFIIYQQQQAGADVTDLEGMFAAINGARDRASACVADGSARLAALAARLDETAPGTAAGSVPDPAELDRITAQADEAETNALIAGRFFSVERMNDKLGEGTACLARAQAQLVQPSQDALAAALDSCDLNRASGYIANGGADPALVQRYNELRRNEATVATSIRQAAGLRDNCDFARAEQVLKDASTAGACAATMNRATRALVAVRAAGRRAAAAEQEYAYANEFYRRGDYQNAYRHLQQARQNAACTPQITRIDNGLRQVAAQIQNAQNTPQQGNTGTSPGTPSANTAIPGLPGIPNFTSDSPVCRKYQQELYALANQQQQMANEMMRTRSDEMSPEMEARAMQNVRQIIMILDKARAASCIKGGDNIPPEVREALGVPNNE